MGIDFFYWIIDDENGFNDLRVRVGYLILAGLILNLPLSDNNPSYVYFY